MLGENRDVGITQLSCFINVHSSLLKPQPFETKRQLILRFLEASSFCDPLVPFGPFHKLSFLDS